SIDPQLTVSASNNSYIVWKDNKTGNDEVYFVSNPMSYHNIFSKKTTANIPIQIKEENVNSSGSNKLLFSTDINIALIEPTFTVAAYDNSFYMFYNLYGHTLAGKNVTRHLDLLSHRVTNQKLTS